jgi:dihydrofolate reductase
MAKLILDISTSLDGFIGGPNPGPEHPLGEGGEQLHEWAFPTKAFREAHGESGGAENADSEVAAELRSRVGATVMGRKMFSGGQGPWEEDPNADAWWGDDPPFRHAVFVLTHHEREPVTKRGGTISRSSRTGSNPPSGRPGRPPATRTSRWVAARAWLSST